MTFVIAIGGPAAAALIALAGWPRALRIAGHAAGVIGAALILSGSIREGVIAGTGFEADPLRAGLALAIASVGAACITRSARSASLEAAWSASVAAGIGSVFASHLVTAGAFLVATSAGVGVAASIARSREAVRMFGLLAGSDLLAIGGLALAASGGARIPPDVGGVAVWLVAVAAIARATLLGSPRWVDAWLCDPASPRACVLGAVRAQGIVLALWVSRSDPTATTAMAGTAAVIAGAAAARAVRSRSWGSGLAGQAALVIAALGIGTQAALVGSVLVMTALGATTIALLAGERTAIGPSAGPAALGAGFAGVVLIATEAMARGIIDRPFLVVALPVVAAAIWLAQAGAVGFEHGHASGLGMVPAGVGLGVVATMVLIPGTVAERIGSAALRSITSSVPVAPVVPAVTDRIGLTFAVAALAAVVALGRAPIAAPTPDARATGPESSTRALLIGWILEMSALAALLAVFASGSARGWL